MNLSQISLAITRQGAAGLPSLNLDFLNSETLDPRITFTRASNATRFNSAGNLVYAPNNWVRNNTMQGAVAGTPGTLPQVSGGPSWFVFTALTGLTTKIIGTSADSGITYIDIQISGTPSAAGVYSIGFETNTGIAASNGQTWSESVYLKLQAGSFTGVSGIRLQNDERSASAYIRTNASSPFTVSSAALNTQRFSFTSTLSGGATVAFIVPYILLNFDGAAIDITLRIGLPQVEIGPTANAAIPTSGTAYQGPRFDYDPVTKAPRGFLLEETRTNRIANTVSTSGVTLSPGSTTGPDGLPMTKAVVVSGALLFAQIGAGAGNTQSFSLTAGQTIEVALSGYFAAGTSGMAVEPRLIADFRTAPSSNMTYAELQINTSNWTVRSKSLGADITELSAPSITQVRAGVYRVTWVIRYTQGATIRDANGVYVQARDATGSGTFTGDGVGHFQYFGLQGEVGRTVSSVIPTTTSAITRAFESPSVNDLNPWFNSAEGTFVSQSIVTGNPVGGATSFVSRFIGASTSNYFANGYVSSDGTATASAYIRNGATAQQSVAINSKLAGVSYKESARYSSSSFRAAANGTLGADVAPIAGVPPVSRLDFATAASSLTTAATGQCWLQRFAYFARAFTDAELQTITL